MQNFYSIYLVVCEKYKYCDTFRMQVKMYVWCCFVSCCAQLKEIILLPFFAHVFFVSWIIYSGIIENGKIT